MSAARDTKHTLESKFASVTIEQAAASATTKAHAEDDDTVMQESTTSPAADQQHAAPASSKDEDEDLDDPEVAQLEAEIERVTQRKRDLQAQLKALLIKKKIAFLEEEIAECEAPDEDMVKELEMVKAWKDGSIDDDTFMRFLLGLPRWA